MKSIFRYLASTKNGLLYFLVGLGVLLILWGMRMPGGDLPYFLSGIALVILAPIFVIVRIMTRLFLKLRKRSDVASVFAGWLIWLLFVELILVTGVVGALGVPFRLAFAVSRPQLEQTVESIANGQKPKGRFWAGVIPISYVESLDEGVLFAFDKDEFPWGKKGIYYSSSGLHIESPHFDSQERIGRQWFLWHYGGW